MNEIEDENYRVRPEARELIDFLKSWAAKHSLSNGDAARKAIHCACYRFVGRSVAPRIMQVVREVTEDVR